MTPTPPHTETVLVIPRPAKLKQGFEPADNLLNLKTLFQENECLWIDRGDAETNTDYKQLIPYVLVMCQGSVFQYYRSSEGNEERLHHTYSVGLGGHVNPCDSESSNDEIILTYLEGLVRELREETGLIISLSMAAKSFVGLVNDDENPVGKVHLGVVHVVEVEPAQASELLKNCERTLERPAFVPLENFKKIQHLGELETWSSMIIKHMLGIKEITRKWENPGFRERISFAAMFSSNLASSLTGLLMQDDARSHLVSRNVVEQNLAELMSIISGLFYNKDVDPAQVERYTEAFIEQLSSYLKHQSASDSNTKREEEQQ
jgi:predicted NUDIX family phosphoesterase